MGKLSNLPSEIILEILTRLPTESVLDCKLVCKPWRYLVSHRPSFSQMHLTHLNRSTDSGKLGFLFLHRRLHYFEYNENNDEDPIDFIKTINFTHPFIYPDYHVVINGLICLYGYQDCTTCICNPITREYVMLPKLKRDLDDRFVCSSSGFGYIPLTNEYKVVELYNLRGEHDFMEVAVYTLGRGNGWRNVGRLDSIVPESFQGVFMNGALYWIQKLHLVKGRQGRVFVFDLTEEKIREHVLLPPSPIDADEMYNFIGDLGGVMYYAIEYYSDVGKLCFYIWLLQNKNDILETKEHVEHEPLGWREEFSHFKGKPLAITKNGGVLCYNSDSLAIYDPVVLTSEIIVDFTELGRIYTHKTTLVSLKEMGEDIQIMKRLK